MPNGNSTVIDALFSSLRLHWQAIEFYTAYAAWIGPQYPKLGKKYRADAEEERGHAQLLLDRLRYYHQPAVFDHDQPFVPTVGYIEFLDVAYALETAAAEVERKNITACREAGDELSAKVFAKLLKGSEGSIQEIEATRDTIAEITLANYLANLA